MIAVGLNFFLVDSVMIMISTLLVVPLPMAIVPAASRYRKLPCFCGFLNYSKQIEDSVLPGGFQMEVLLRTILHLYNKSDARC